MKILNIIQCMNLGGMEKANLLHMKHFLSLGHKITVISIHPLGPGALLYEAAGIPVIGCEYSGKFGLLSHHKLRRAVKSHPADVIFITGASISSCLAARMHRVPQILCVHYAHGHNNQNFIKWKIFYRLFSKKFSVITFCSDFIRAEAEFISPELAKKSITLRNIFEINVLDMNDRSAARQKLGLPSEVPIIGNAGWLINGKRFDVLLKTASLVMQKIPGLHVAIAGGGECESKLRKLSQDLGLKDRVHWLGWLPDLANFYQSLDVLVFNSDFDAMGCTPIEAMAWGIPVVASVSYGGLREVITHKETGFLLNDHNLQLLADYTVTLLNNKLLKENIGKAGQELIKERFCQDLVATQLDIMLDNIL